MAQTPDDLLCHRYALAEARGDLALYVALRALRHVEDGRAGLEMGVEDPRADTYELQMRFAANTLRHYERDVLLGNDVTAMEGDPIRSADTGLYTDAFIVYMSHRYAPLGADNDPTNLNANHARNWCSWYATYSTGAISALTAL